MENKKRLIDADALQRLLIPIATGLEKEYGNLGGAIAGVMQHIDNAPTIDAVEVVHGRWKYYHKQNIAVCTNCSFERNLDADFGKAVSCPNCGAKMDGDVGA